MLTISLPSVSWQVGLASGTVILVVTGDPDAAAILGVGVRLLTGINQLAAVLATALFPALARVGDPAQAPRPSENESRMIDLAARAAVALTSVAFAVYLLRPSFFVNLFLKSGGIEAERTAAITVGTASVAGVSLLTSFVLVARHREAIAALAFTLGAALTVLAGAVFAAAAPRNVALWVASALAAGQFVGMALAVGRTSAIRPELRRSLTTAAVSGTAVLVGAVVYAATQQAHLLVAGGCIVLAAVLLRRQMLIAGRAAHRGAERHRA